MYACVVCIIYIHVMSKSIHMLSKYTYMICMIHIVVDFMFQF